MNLINFLNKSFENFSPERISYLPTLFQKYNYLLVEYEVMKGSKDKKSDVTIVFIKEKSDINLGNSENHSTINVRDFQLLGIPKINIEPFEPTIISLSELKVPSAEIIESKNISFQDLDVLESIETTQTVDTIINGLYDDLSFDDCDVYYEKINEKDNLFSIEKIYDKYPNEDKYGYIVYRTFFDNELVMYTVVDGKWTDTYSNFIINKSNYEKMIKHINNTYGKNTFLEHSLDESILSKFDGDFLDLVDKKREEISS